MFVASSFWTLGIAFNRGTKVTKEVALERMEQPTRCRSGVARTATAAGPRGFLSAARLLR